MPKKKKFIPKPSKFNSEVKNVRSLVLSLFEKTPEAILTHKQICQVIAATKPAVRQHVYDALISLVEKKRLTQVNHHSFKIAEGSVLLSGLLETTQKGFGFVRCDAMESDVFIASSNLATAINGDKVSFRVLPSRKGKPEGVIVSVIERSRVQFAGTVRIKNNKAVLIPDNQKSGIAIQLLETKLNGAKNGMKVIAKVTVWPSSSGMPFGEVVALLGYPGSNDAEMISILVNQGFDPHFPQEVMEEAESISIAIPESEIIKRRDFREVLTFTIDPLDAKDFDDAISFKKLDNGHFEIGVHIADVGHYVKEKSHLDKEALKRSNSVYLVDRVMPMLPEQLSNVICSLRPNEDKLCFTSCFELNSKGDLISEWFGKTIIHSDRRFTYEEAQEIIEGQSGDYENEIRVIDGISKSLRKKRFKNGALNIESEELRFKLDEKGQPIGTILKKSKDAHKLIEELMLLANKQVSKFLSPKESNTTLYKVIYRVHDNPDPEKLAMLTMFCDKFGHKLNIDSPKNAAKTINEFLEIISGENEYPLIQSMVIRSMAKATYSTENIGHYGLAFSHYSHFTSPIRRYADLIVHRLLDEKLSSQKIKLRNDLEDICKRISINEKKATEAERESTKYFQTLLLLDHIGETFRGIISGFSEHGMFVKIIENQCEGMIPYQSIREDRFSFNPDKYEVKGSKNGRVFNLGDEINVLIDEVSPRKRQIDLLLV